MRLNLTKLFVIKDRVVGGDYNGKLPLIKILSSLDYIINYTYNIF